MSSLTLYYKTQSQRIHLRRNPIPKIRVWWSGTTATNMAITLTPKAATTKTVMLQIDPDLYVRIKTIAKQHNMAAAVAMRQILEQGINEIESNLG